MPTFTQSLVSSFAAAIVATAFSYCSYRVIIRKETKILVDTKYEFGKSSDGSILLIDEIPGWSCLSNARVTLFGDVYPLEENEQERAHKQYTAKHQHGPSEQWGNFHYFRMKNISDIYFIGRFGTVAWVNVKEYGTIKPDKIAVDGGEQNLKELNSIFSNPLRELLSAEAEIDDAALITIDSKGIDIRVRQGAQFSIQRLAFEEGDSVETMEEAKSALWKVIERAKMEYFQK